MENRDHSHHRRHHHAQQHHNHHQHDRHRPDQAHERRDPLEALNEKFHRGVQKAKRFFEKPKVQSALTAAAIVAAVLVVGAATVAAITYFSEGEVDIIDWVNNLFGGH
jgi:hypothetical protein